MNRNQLSVATKSAKATSPIFVLLAAFLLAMGMALFPGQVQAAEGDTSTTAADGGI